MNKISIAGEQQSAKSPNAITPTAIPKSATSGAFFWLSMFYLVYCARPEDWIPGLSHIPMAKITGIFAFIGLLISLGRTQRKFKDLPREAMYLLAMCGVLTLSALLSPVWRGGALSRTVDFSKVYIAWVLTFLLVTEFSRLRRIMYIQAVSVAVISAVSVIKGHSMPRLDGVLGGIYSNPNDLAFAVVLTLPFCLAFLLTTKSILAKFAWLGGILIMSLTLLMTASRGGFVTLVISGAVCLWHFGIKGRRIALLVATGFTAVLLLVVAGGPLMRRMEAISGHVTSLEENRAYGSYEDRKYLMKRAVEGIVHYPILGIGVRNFETYSGIWREVHMTYLQICVEGGIPSLILYLLFFGRGFSNLRKLRKRSKELDEHTVLLVGALHSSLVGFVIGALFSPEAYQFFPYFAIAYTSALAATLVEQGRITALADDRRELRRLSAWDVRKPLPVAPGR
jgi:O-antigen ligase